jgi:hypothetical protein
MDEHATRGTTRPSDERHEDRGRDRQDRPPVAAFDPYFGPHASGGGRETSDFDEMMWDSAA